MTSEVVISHPRSPSEFQSPAAGRWDGLQAGHKCHVCISTYTWINLCPISWETWLSCQLVLGAGALQVVGLKTITTKNLGMDFCI